MADKKWILIVDDPELVQMLAEPFRRYKDIDVVTATDAGKCLEIVRERGLPDVLATESRVSYGNAMNELQGEFDERCHFSGYRLVKAIYEMSTANDAGTSGTWFALMAMSSADFTVGFGSSEGHKEATRFLNKIVKQGRGKQYVKPFDSLVFEDDICRVLGITSEYHDFLAGRSM